MRIRVPPSSKVLFENEDVKKAEVRGECRFVGCVIDVLVVVGESCLCFLEACIILQLTCLKSSVVLKNCQLGKVDLALCCDVKCENSSFTDMLFMERVVRAQIEGCTFTAQSGVLAVRCAGIIFSRCRFSAAEVVFARKCVACRVMDCDFEQCKTRALCLAAGTSEIVCCIVENSRFIGNRVAV